MLRTPLTALCLALLASPAFAAAPAVDAEVVGDVYVVQASFDLPPGVSREVAWQVLTDYAHLGGFVHGIRKCEVRARDGNGILLEQEVVAHLAVLSRTAHLLLRVKEEPEQGLSFDDVSRADFELYRGAWELRDGPAGLEVHYLLRAKPRHGPPALLGTRAMDGAIAELVNGLRNEMQARAAQAHAAN